VADAEVSGRGQGDEDAGRLSSGDCSQRTTGRSAVGGSVDGGGLANATNGQLSFAGRGSEERDGTGPDGADNTGCSQRPGPAHSFWQDTDWLLCRDGKWRSVEPGTSPLAYGVASRVGRLRAYGNAIVAPLATEFIAAVMDCQP
jgi:DNA (cytosine-5)-methyltransferase 1